MARFRPGTVSGAACSSGNAVLASRIDRSRQARDTRRRLRSHSGLRIVVHRRSDMPYAAVNGLNMYYEVHGEVRRCCCSTAEVARSPRTGSRSSHPGFGYAIEQMGHGRTGDAMDRAFHYHDMAEDTVALMRPAAGRACPHRRLQRRRDHRARHRHPSSRARREARPHRREHPRGRLHARGAGAWPDLRSHGGTGPDWYARISPDGAGHWPVLQGRLSQCGSRSRRSRRSEVGSVRPPTLIIIGDGDIVTPEHAVEMFRTIPRSQLCVVPNAGHGVLPKETVLTFLKESSAQT